MIIVQHEWYTKEQVRRERDKIFVFGDNLARKGTGGQAAACRDEPNTIGIVTKWDEKRNPGSYMYDTTLEINKVTVMEGFNKVLSMMRSNVRGEPDPIIVFPADGFGTGLANLASNAPETLQFITDVTAYIIKVDQVNRLDKEIKDEADRLWPGGYFSYVR